MKVLRKIFIIGLCSLLVLTAVAAAFFLITTKDSKLNEENRDLRQRRKRDRTDLREQGE